MYQYRYYYYTKDVYRMDEEIWTIDYKFCATDNATNKLKNKLDSLAKLKCQSLGYHFIFGKLKYTKIMTENIMREDAELYQRKIKERKHGTN